MKKSTNERKKEFLKRIKYQESTKNDEVKDNEEERTTEPEEPSIIAERIILKHLRGHIGKKYDEEIDR